MRIDVKYRDHFLVDYRYGFNSSTHVYFVTVQKKSYLPGQIMFSVEMFSKNIKYTALLYSTALLCSTAILYSTTLLYLTDRPVCTVPPCFTVPPCCTKMIDLFVQYALLYLTGRPVCTVRLCRTVPICMYCTALFYYTRIFVILKLY